VTFSDPIRVVPVAHGTASFVDLAVGPDGAVYIAYITYPSSSNPSTDIWVSKSTDGGFSFGAPAHVAGISIFDSSQFSGNGSSDCGDGPFACPTGLTFSRFSSAPAVAADASGVHVVWNGRLAGGQSKVFVRNSPDGVIWSTPAATLDAVPTGHQWTPDIASDRGTIDVVFYDSRADPAYSPNLPPGDTAGGASSGDVVNTFLAKSSRVPVPVTTFGSAAPRLIESGWRRSSHCGATGESARAEMPTTGVSMTSGRSSRPLLACRGSNKVRVDGANLSSRSRGIHVGPSAPTVRIVTAAQVIGLVVLLVVLFLGWFGQEREWHR
jgi:hypothetical protein